MPELLSVMFVRIIQDIVGPVLGEDIDMSAQAVYAASSRVERDGGLDMEAMERRCR
jgi:hypothetical protein